MEVNTGARFTSPTVNENDTVSDNEGLPLSEAITSIFG